MAAPAATMARAEIQMTSSEDKINADLDGDESKRRLILEPMTGWLRRESS
jgi:hypothetical protein